MHLTRALPVIGLATMAVAIACSDSSSTAPNDPRTSVSASGQSDTGKTPPTNPTPPKPDSAKPTSPSAPGNPTAPPDTGVTVQASNDPRSVVGTVVGMGPASDSANYQKVAGATVVLSLPADAANGVPEKEIARATSGADGTFSLGSFKPGMYALSVTPPAGSPYDGTHWNFTMGPYSGPKVDLMVWLKRK